VQCSDGSQEEHVDEAQKDQVQNSDEAKEDQVE